jgi:hypothetical protein
MMVPACGSEAWRVGVSSFLFFYDPPRSSGRRHSSILKGNRPLHHDMDQVSHFGKSQLCDSHKKEHTGVSKIVSKSVFGE